MKLHMKKNSMKGN